MSNEMNSEEVLGMAILLAAVAAPFIANGVSKQEAFEKAQNIVESSVSFITSQENKPEEPAE